MTSCNVVKTCFAVGMKPVCEGQRYEHDIITCRMFDHGCNNNRKYTCFGTNVHDCYMTPFSDKPTSRDQSKRCGVQIEGLTLKFCYLILHFILLKCSYLHCILATNSKFHNSIFLPHIQGVKD